MHTLLLRKKCKMISLVNDFHEFADKKLLVIDEIQFLELEVNEANIQELVEEYDKELNSNLSFQIILR